MEDTQEKHLEFFDKLLSFPVINETWSYVKAKYEEVQNIEYVGAAVKSAKDVLQSAAEKSKPLLHKVDRQISAVDDFAVKSLDKLEEKFPVTKKQPNEIRENIVSYLAEIKVPSYFLPYGKTALSLALDCVYIIWDIAKRIITKEMIIKAMESVADFIVPPVRGEEEKSAEYETFWDAASSLLAKFQARIKFYGQNILEGKATEAGIDWKDFPLLVLSVKFLALHRVVYYEMIAVVLSLFNKS
ncbi:uncharacterized protein LOC111633220 [Centruroides sculpturatus]|uniref:uncharacterized protein LOC111633220 n=1 Tax=Centruroides sculpturatus TaxID=218467 RepID=UPI000C6CA92E|nr:uncharacterized protein LOC111633220 [Centruroides sculpturatus]